MSNRTFSILTAEELAKLPTHRLLAYKRKIMMAHETPTWADGIGPGPGDEGFSKAHPEWIALNERVKAECAKREHVE